MSSIVPKTIFRASVCFVIATLAGFAALVFNPWIVDGLLWRFERLEPNPTVGQRIFENRSHLQALWDDQSVPDNSILLFGDSHLRLLKKSKLPNLYNFAIGGQTVGRMADRIKQFKSARKASLIVLSGGENDLSEDASVELIDQRWASLIAALPPKVRVLCVGLPEWNGPRIHGEFVEKVNQNIRKRCAEISASTLIPLTGVSPLESPSDSPDGMHLSRAGMEVFLKQIEQVVQQ